jgi:hypothetical protein
VASSREAGLSSVGGHVSAGASRNPVVAMR